VFKFREIWPSGNRWNRALFSWQKNFACFSNCRYCGDRSQNLPGPVHVWHVHGMSARRLWTNLGHLRRLMAWWCHLWLTGYDDNRCKYSRISSGWLFAMLSLTVPSTLAVYWRPVNKFRRVHWDMCVCMYVYAQLEDLQLEQHWSVHLIVKMLLLLAIQQMPRNLPAPRNLQFQPQQNM